MFLIKFKNYFILLLFMGFIFYSCTYFTRNNITGTYVPNNYKNNYDTIWIQNDGIYHRKVYDLDKNLLLDMKSKWRFNKYDVIKFDAFFVNFDRNLLKFPELVKDTLGGWGGRLQVINSLTGFSIDHNAKEYKYFYHKID